MRQWVRLRLDLSDFDDARVEPVLARCRRAGVRFATVAELGDDEGCRRLLYELNRACSADIPGRGEFYTWEQYLADRIDTRSYDPTGVAIALDGARWVGMAATSIRPTAEIAAAEVASSPTTARLSAFAEMTGVVRGYRRRGIAVSLKLCSIRWAQATGVSTMRTCHHPGNARMIEVNRRLGFVDDCPG